MIRNNLMRAITYAANKHRDQVRKVDKTPFIAHPYRVAMLLQEHDCDAEIVIAALLHDTVEDTDCTFEEIEHLFGGGVKTYVDYVTELDKHVPWKERKEHSIEAFKSVPYDVKLLIAADKIDNLQSMIDQEMVHGEAMCTTLSAQEKNKSGITARFSHQSQRTWQMMSGTHSFICFRHYSKNLLKVT
ncbi:HD domain-containing protein [Halolactibacillus sp. JCM 19043]|uniref:HD domain-containing protein n=1 Tax=Halolactibacillus sp. JCM 19043 TaxID=1460638 RepID=UPI000A4E717F|nr:HD domain-containing protein [Halolactibacillus sp. JCM 19043]